MLKQKRYLYLNRIELKIVTDSLIRLKNSLVQQGRYTDCVDELLIKILGPQVQ